MEPGQPVVAHRAYRPERCDYAIASGILNVRRGADPESWLGYLDDTIALLAANSRLASASTSCPCHRILTSIGPTFFCNPVAMLALCLGRYGHHVALLQDYGLWEFTLLVRHSR